MYYDKKNIISMLIFVSFCPSKSNLIPNTEISVNSVLLMILTQENLALIY